MDWMRHSMTTFLVLDIVTTRGTSLITGITVITNKYKYKLYLIRVMGMYFYLLSMLSVRFAFSSPFPFFILHLYNPVSSLPGF